MDNLAILECNVGTLLYEKKRKIQTFDNNKLSSWTKPLVNITH